MKTEQELEKQNDDEERNSLSWDTLKKLEAIFLRW